MTDPTSAQEAPDVRVVRARSRLVALLASLPFAPSELAESIADLIDASIAQALLPLSNVAPPKRESALRPLSAEPVLLATVTHWAEDRVVNRRESIMSTLLSYACFLTPDMLTDKGAHIFATRLIIDDLGRHLPAASWAPLIRVANAARSKEEIDRPFRVTRADRAASEVAKEEFRQALRAGWPPKDAYDRIIRSLGVSITIADLPDAPHRARFLAWVKGARDYHQGICLEGKGWE